MNWTLPDTSFLIPAVLPVEAARQYVEDAAGQAADSVLAGVDTFAGVAVDGASGAIGGVADAASDAAGAVAGAVSDTVDAVIDAPADAAEAVMDGVEFAQGAMKDVEEGRGVKRAWDAAEHYVIGDARKRIRTGVEDKVGSGAEWAGGQAQDVLEGMGLSHDAIERHKAVLGKDFSPEKELFWDTVWGMWRESDVKRLKEALNKGSQKVAQLAKKSKAWKKVASMLTNLGKFGTKAAKFAGKAAPWMKPLTVGMNTYFEHERQVKGPNGDWKEREPQDVKKQYQRQDVRAGILAADYAYMGDRKLKKGGAEGQDFSVKGDKKQTQKGADVWGSDAMGAGKDQYETGDATDAYASFQANQGFRKIGGRSDFDVGGIFYNFQTDIGKSLAKKETKFDIFFNEKTGQLCMSFRGTSSKGEILNDVSSAFMAPMYDNAKPPSLIGNVGTGFLNQYMKSEPYIQKTIDELETRLAALDPPQSVRGVITSGHSLGGAMAQIAANALNTRLTFKSQPPPAISCVSVAAPMAGDVTFSKMLTRNVGGEDHLTRILNSKDPVPQGMGFWNMTGDVISDMTLGASKYLKSKQAVLGNYMNFLYKGMKHDVLDGTKATGVGKDLGVNFKKVGGVFDKNPVENPDGDDNFYHAGAGWYTDNDIEDDDFEELTPQEEAARWMAGSDQKDWLWDNTAGRPLMHKMGQYKTDLAKIAGYRDADGNLKTFADQTANDVGENAEGDFYDVVDGIPYRIDRPTDTANTDQDESGTGQQQQPTDDREPWEVEADRLAAEQAEKDKEKGEEDTDDDGLDTDDEDAAAQGAIDAELQRKKELDARILHDMDNTLGARGSRWKEDFNTTRSDMAYVSALRRTLDARDEAEREAAGMFDDDDDDYLSDGVAPSDDELSEGEVSDADAAAEEEEDDDEEDEEEEGVTDDDDAVMVITEGVTGGEEEEEKEQVSLNVGDVTDPATF